MAAFGGEDSGAGVPVGLPETERSVLKVLEEEGWQGNEEDRLEEHRAKAKSCCRPGWQQGGQGCQVLADEQWRRRPCQAGGCEVPQAGHLLEPEWPH